MGRLRKYLNVGEGREFDITDTRTPESHLVNPDSPSWYVPEGREGWMRVKRQSTGRSVRNVRGGDTGPFKADDFRTAASNDRDHSRTLDVPMPQQVIDELQAIIDANIFPSRNIKALARTLLVEGIATLHEIARQHDLVIPKSHPQRIDQICRINRNLQATLAYDDELEQMCELVRMHRRRGMKNKARASLHEVLAIVKEIPSEELRVRWERDLKSEFRDLMRGRPAMIHVKEEAPAEVDDDYGSDEIR